MGRQWYNMYTFKSSVTFKIGVKAMKVVRIIKKILAIWVTGAVAVPVSYFGFSTTMIQSVGISIGVMVVMSLFFIMSSARRHYQNPYRRNCIRASSSKRGKKAIKNHWKLSF